MSLLQKVNQIAIKISQGTRLEEKQFNEAMRTRNITFNKTDSPNGGLSSLSLKADKLSLGFTYFDSSNIYFIVSGERYTLDAVLKNLNKTALNSLENELDKILQICESAKNSAHLKRSENAKNAGGDPHMNRLFTFK